MSVHQGPTPVLALGRSGQCVRRFPEQPNNKAALLTYVRDTTGFRESGAWPTTSTTAGGNGGANEEPFAFHPGGVNALMGDGSVRFVKSSINLAAFRAVLTLNGGDVVSADQF